MKKKITMKDIADFLNIDRTTVSKALTGAPGVSLKTIEKVQQAADELGYRKDSFASSLQTRKNAVLGLIMADFRRGIYAPLVEAFQQTAMEYHYSTIIFYVNRNQNDLANAIELLKQQRVSGATFISAAATADLYEYVSDFLEDGIAVNTLERDFVPYGIDRVSFNHYKAGCDLTEHMIAEGHRGIVFVTYADIKGTPEGRLHGYLDAMKKHALAPRVIAEDKPLSHAPGDEMMLAYERIHKAWDRLDQPTALIGVNDNFALGILHALKDKRIDVPGTISLAGFDDLNASLGIPQLTTMRSPMKQSGSKLAELLIRRIRQSELPATAYTLDYDIIVRKSTAPR
ncbi:Catabolite control protein A [Paenibacillus solanacearum]|uniref:Catabolite control protein A n=1 Tax=Paenibacillus solanacearum TaxID=2048548 RepID=A0A916K7X0_9BACL|nr:LacI family DNA-binding transcriptional regulator [Paenibacillus solanacearum]CAG7647969.1 Catabolite control protein A [Paenibacillus solanacearum]